VDPVPDPLLLRKSGSAGNQTLTSESVARNSDNKTTEAVSFQLNNNNNNNNNNILLTAIKTLVVSLV
jgi:hypothetical protein